MQREIGYVPFSERPKDYRAPTFSWAAVEAERGIKYGEFIDQPIAGHRKAVGLTQDRGEPQETQRRHAERMGNAERHDAHDMNGEVAQRCRHRPTAMQPVERRQERHDHEMAGDLDTKGTTPARRMAAPGLVDDLAVGAGDHRQDEQSGPNRHQSPMPRHHRAFSQSISGVQQSSRARPLTTMPI